MESLACLEDQLATFSAPFIAEAVADLTSRGQPLVLDADLTGQPVSASSTSYPAAAFGYMDGPSGAGYQLALLCLQTGRYGRQWLVGQQHPGDVVSAPCLLSLVEQAERRLGGHPRRRPELLDERSAAIEAAARTAEARTQQQTDRAAQCLAREERLLAQITDAQHQLYALHRQPASARQGGAYGALTRWQQQIATWQRRLGPHPPAVGRRGEAGRAGRRPSRRAAPSPA